jgi:hypothetical protein
MRRRELLIGLGGLGLAACVRPAPRAPAPTESPERPAEFSAWEREAKAILSDALQTLRTFEDFLAFRLTFAAQTDRRATSELAWDPPSGRAWDEATHVARGLRGRSEQLFQQVSQRVVDAAAWREQRDMAANASALRDLGDALDDFRVRTQYLAAAGDGTAAWEVLDRAWARYDASAAQWGTGRAELIACAAGGG